jgi:hypothetical protein
LGLPCDDPAREFQGLVAEFRRRFAHPPGPEPGHAVDAAQVRKRRDPRPPKKQRVPKPIDIVTADDGAIGLKLGRSGRLIWFSAEDAAWA